MSIPSFSSQNPYNSYPNYSNNDPFQPSAPPMEEVFQPSAPPMEEVFNNQTPGSVPYTPYTPPVTASSAPYTPYTPPVTGSSAPYTRYTPPDAPTENKISEKLPQAKEEDSGSFDNVLFKAASLGLSLFKGIFSIGSSAINFVFSPIQMTPEEKKQELKEKNSELLGKWKNIEKYQGFSTKNLKEEVSQLLSSVKDMPLSKFNRSNSILNNLMKETLIFEQKMKELQENFNAKIAEESKKVISFSQTMKVFHNLPLNPKFDYSSFAGKNHPEKYTCETVANMDRETLAYFKTWIERSARFNENFDKCCFEEGLINAVIERCHELDKQL